MSRYPKDYTGPMTTGGPPPGMKRQVRQTPIKAVPGSGRGAGRAPSGGIASGLGRSTKR